MSSGQIRVLVLLVVLALMEAAIQPNVKAYIASCVASISKGMTR